MIVAKDHSDRCARLTVFLKLEYADHFAREGKASIPGHECHNVKVIGLMAAVDPLKTLATPICYQQNAQ